MNIMKSDVNSNDLDQYGGDTSILQANPNQEKKSNTGILTLVRQLKGKHTFLLIAPPQFATYP
jgi:hypothetical protein